MRELVRLYLNLSAVSSVDMLNYVRHESGSEELIAAQSLEASCVTLLISSGVDNITKTEEWGRTG